MPFGNLRQDLSYEKASPASSVGRPVLPPSTTEKGRLFFQRRTLYKPTGRTVICGKSIDESLRASTIDDIVAEGGDPASGCFGGQYKVFADW